MQRTRTEAHDRASRIGIIPRPRPSHSRSRYDGVAGVNVNADASLREQSRADINSSNLRRLRIQYPCLAQTRASPWATRPEASEEAGTRAGIPYCISAVPYRTQLLYLLAAAVAAIVACDVCVWLECE